MLKVSKIYIFVEILNTKHVSDLEVNLLNYDIR